MPMTAEWALHVIDLHQTPKDFLGAARIIEVPNYDEAVRMAYSVPADELALPIVSGLRFILDPNRERASAAEHWRMKIVLEYVAPVFPQQAPEFSPLIGEFCAHFHVRI